MSPVSKVGLEIRTDLCVDDPIDKGSWVVLTGFSSLLQVALNRLSTEHGHAKDEESWTKTILGER